MWGWHDEITVHLLIKVMLFRNDFLQEHSLGLGKETFPHETWCHQTLTDKLGETGSIQIRCVDFSVGYVEIEWLSCTVWTVAQHLFVLQLSLRCRVSISFLTSMKENLPRRQLCKCFAVGQPEGQSWWKWSKHFVFLRVYEGRLVLEFYQR